MVQTIGYIMCVNRLAQQNNTITELINILPSVAHAHQYGVCTELCGMLSRAKGCNIIYYPLFMLGR